MDSSMSGSVNPGDEIPVTLTLRNAGQTLADDVTLRIENVSGTVAPKNADAYHLGSIIAGGLKTVDLTLLSDKKTVAGLVRIPVTIRYNAIDGSQRTQTDRDRPDDERQGRTGICFCGYQPAAALGKYTV